MQIHLIVLTRFFISINNENITNFFLCIKCFLLSLRLVSFFFNLESPKIINIWTKNQIRGDWNDIQCIFFNLYFLNSYIFFEKGLNPSIKWVNRWGSGAEIQIVLPNRLPPEPWQLGIEFPKSCPLQEIDVSCFKFKRNTNRLKKLWAHQSCDTTSGSTSSWCWSHWADHSFAETKSYVGLHLVTACCCFQVFTKYLFWKLQINF